MILKKLENGKFYKFAAENSHMKNVWLKALKTEVDKLRNKTENEEITQFKVKANFKSIFS